VKAEKCIEGSASEYESCGETPASPPTSMSPLSTSNSEIPTSTIKLPISTSPLPTTISPLPTASLSCETGESDF